MKVLAYLSMVFVSVGVNALWAIEGVGTEATNNAIAAKAEFTGKAEKIVGPLLGFYTSRRPVWCWVNLGSDRRLTGPISDTVKWDDIEKIHVLFGYLHIRGPGDVEGFIRNSLSKTILVETLPDGRAVEDEDNHLQLQAMLQLKDGSYALLSVSGRFVVIEHNLKVGLGHS